MDLIFSEDEKDILRKLQSLKNTLMGKALSPQRVETFFIKHIIINRLASLQINPTLGQFDAFVDEIESYIEKSSQSFAAFIREHEERDGNR